MLDFVTDVPYSGSYTGLAEPWIGVFWTKMHQDRDLVRALMLGRGLIAAQLHVDTVEAASLLSRELLPVYHRQQYQPVILKLSQRNLGPLLYVGSTPTAYVGAQPEASQYWPGTVYVCGNGGLSRRDLVSYRLDKHCDRGPSSFSSGIKTAALTYYYGEHYFVENDVIYFRDDCDPFTKPEFAIRSTGTDKELLGWGTDVMTDLDYVSAFAQALGIRRRPGISAIDFAKVVTGVFDYLVMPSHTKLVAGIGAALGAPVSVDDEVVMYIDVTRIITDKRSYDLNTCTPIYSVGDSVQAGTSLSSKFELKYGRELSQAFFSDNGITHLQLQVPAGSLGFAVAKTDIVYAGTDGNGNPKLWFQLMGDADTVTNYWAEVWSNVEALGLDMSTGLEQWLSRSPPYLTPGTVVGSISPLDYLIQAQANKLVLVLVRNDSGGYSMGAGVMPKLLQALPSDLVLVVLVLAETTLTDDTGSDSTSVYTYGCVGTETPTPPLCSHHLKRV